MIWYLNRQCLKKTDKVAFLDQLLAKSMLKIQINTHFLLKHPIFF